MTRENDSPLAEEIEVLRQPLVTMLDTWTRGKNEAVTPLPNLMFYRREVPTSPGYCMVQPSVSLVIQGTKRALLGEEAYDYNLDHFLITSLDLPSMMHIIDASSEKPYLGLMLKLDLRVLSDVMLQFKAAPLTRPIAARGMFLGKTTRELLGSFTRLVALMDEPDAIAILAPLIEREIYYRLLTSDQSARLWQIASVGSQGHRIARAVEWLRANYTHSLRVEELAAMVQMSSSTFHVHFRNLTSMSPLQYQKWLRLNEARRLMLSEHQDVSTTAFRVGYESPSQFSREYRRFFGDSPRHDIEQLRRFSPAV